MKKSVQYVLMSASIALWMYIALGILGAAVIVAFVLLWKQQQLLKAFMRGKSGEALEDTVKWTIEKLAQVDERLKTHKAGLEQIDARVQRSLQTPPLTKFNANQDLGSEQSFATSFVNENGDGFILSALTHRNHLGLYAKKLIKFEPEHALTDEETRVLAASKKALQKK